MKERIIKSIDKAQKTLYNKSANGAQMYLIKKEDNEWRKRKKCM